MFFRESILDPPPPLVLPDGRLIAVHVRASSRARRLALRLHPTGDAVEVVLPQGVSLRRALAFLRDRSGWVAARADALPRRVAFEPGVAIPILGAARRLVAVGAIAGPGHPPFALLPDRIEVTGRPEHFARRVRAGLVEETRRRILAKVPTLAATLAALPLNRAPRRVGRIGVGDARTRWGSCAASGNLNFSWRLILTPEPVMDYVVAHEVAHLVEMNHSIRFWRVVAALHPGFETERDWLKREGARLHRYG